MSKSTETTSHGKVSRAQVGYWGRRYRKAVLQSCATATLYEVDIDGQTYYLIADTGAERVPIIAWGSSPDQAWIDAARVCGTRPRCSRKIAI